MRLRRARQSYPRGTTNENTRLYQTTLFADLRRVRRCRRTAHPPPQKRLRRARNDPDRLHRVRRPGESVDGPGRRPRGGSWRRRIASCPGRRRPRRRTGGNWDFCADYRKILDRKDIDAVFIPTTDHARSFLCVHACMAGKDAYAGGNRLLSVSARAVPSSMRRGSTNGSSKSVLSNEPWR